MYRLSCIVSAQNLTEESFDGFEKKSACICDILNILYNLI